MNAIKKSASYVAAAFLGAVLALMLYSQFNTEKKTVVLDESKPIQLSSYTPPALPQAQLPDLTQAAEKSVSAVVHITTKSKSQFSDGNNQFFDFFFGPRGYQQQEPQPRMAAGSGVIISDDGFIVTKECYLWIKKLSSLPCRL